jgi:hypothetical protein
VQFVLLLCLLVAEVIIQQHQLLQKSSFGSSNGALPVTAQATGGAYQRLPGSAAECDDKQKQRQVQEQPQPLEKFSAWWVQGLSAPGRQQLEQQHWAAGVLQHAWLDACAQHTSFCCMVFVPSMPECIEHLNCLQACCTRLLSPLQAPR